MVPFALVPLGRKRPSLLLRVDFPTLHAAYLVTPLAGEDQDLYEGAAWVAEAVRCLPDGAQFVACQDPLTRCLDLPLFDDGGRVRVDPLAFDRPIERRNDLG